MLCELAGCGSYVLLLDTPLGFQTICVRLVQAMLETFFRLVQKPCRDLLLCIALCLIFLRKPQYYFSPISSHLYILPGKHGFCIAGTIQNPTSRQRPLTSITSLVLWSTVTSSVDLIDMQGKESSLWDREPPVVTFSSMWLH